uniref:Uncharacterized protein n=1 Tax=Arion vulgaris TaxID=1028688 RepID=A0A0B6Y332_9EUPU
MSKPGKFTSPLPKWLLSAACEHIYIVSYIHIRFMFEKQIRMSVEHLFSLS